VIERRHELISAMQELIDAHAGGREVMDTADSLLRVGIEQIESGSDFMEAMAKAPAAAERQVTQDAFKRIIDARHALRLQLLRLCLEQGLTPREIGERWGVSRQRVMKYKAELDKNQVAAPDLNTVVGYALTGSDSVR